MGSQARADHFACQKNLQNIYALLLDYKTTRQHYPVKGGVKFLLYCPGPTRRASTASRTATTTSARRSGRTTRTTSATHEAPVAGLWPNIETVTSADSNYAGRRRGEAGVALNFESDTECIAADDNEQGSNHRDMTVNMLFGSGSVRQLLHSKLEIEGVLKKEDQWIPARPEVPDRRSQEAVQGLTLIRPGASAGRPPIRSDP